MMNDYNKSPEYYAKEWIKPQVAYLRHERKNLEPCLKHTTGALREARVLMIERLNKAIDILNGK